MEAKNVDFSLLDKYVYLSEDNRKVIEEFVKGTWEDEFVERVLAIEGTYMTGKTHLFRVLTHLVNPQTTRMVEENNEYWGEPLWRNLVVFTQTGRHYTEIFENLGNSYTKIKLNPVTTSKLLEKGICLDYPPMKKL